MREAESQRHFCQGLLDARLVQILHQRCDVLHYLLFMVAPEVGLPEFTRFEDSVLADVAR